MCVLVRIFHTATFHIFLQMSKTPQAVRIYVLVRILHTMCNLMCTQSIQIIVMVRVGKKG